MSQQQKTSICNGGKKKLVYPQYMAAYRALVALRLKYNCKFLHDYYCAPCKGWHIGRDAAGREVKDVGDLIPAHELQYTTTGDATNG